MAPSGALLNVQRGQNGTTPAAHAAGTVVVLISACVGDCNNDGGAVTLDEVVTMVDIAFGHTPLAACQAGDANHDGQITVDELLRAVNNALTGCPGV